MATSIQSFLVGMHEDHSNFHTQTGWGAMIAECRRAAEHWFGRWNCRTGWEGPALRPTTKDTKRLAPYKAYRPQGGDLARRVWPKTG
jgi:hypothetical protein